MLNPLSLNPSLLDHVDIYREMWRSCGIVTITNIINLEQANILNQYLLDLPEEKWNYSVHPYLPDMYTFSNTPENKDHIVNGIKSSSECYNKGGFSYCFRRYDGFKTDGIALEEFMVSSDVLNIIHTITGLDVKNVVSLFASYYGSDSFLSTHSDQGRGSVALVLNLTKNWDKNNGGCLELLDNGHAVIHKVPPKFNSLTLFDVRGNGVPHRVTRIPHHVTGKRLAFSGWLV